MFSNQALEHVMQYSSVMLLQYVQDGMPVCHMAGSKWRWHQVGGDASCRQPQPWNSQG